ncbi:MAG TPA: FixH family protein [Candidatus Binatia bacterium]|nr:FixH family protein [Candidatus Binatia bacterium]
MTRGWMWPAGLVALLVLSASANIGFMLIAGGDPSFAVERDYYGKALAWDATMVQAARNRALGWQLDADIRPTRDARAELAVRIADRSGAPVADAAVTAEAFHGARAARVYALRLEPDGAGRYRAELPDGRPGLWELRVRATRDDEVFTRTLGRDLAAPTP